MKKVCLILTTIAIAASSLADIQAPPSGRWNPIGKLSRGLSNVLYGFTEIPAQWSRTNRADGASTAATYGVLLGARKTVMRVAWGLYDVVSFPMPTYKGGYRAPYLVKQEMNPTLGYAEYPPELGFLGSSRTTRWQQY